MQYSVQRSTVRLHTLMLRLRSWCSCMAVALSQLSTLFVRPTLPWLLQDGPITRSSNFRMPSLPALMPSLANSLEMAGGLYLSWKKRKILGLV